MSPQEVQLVQTYFTTDGHWHEQWVHYEYKDGRLTSKPTMMLAVTSQKPKMGDQGHPASVLSCIHIHSESSTRAHVEFANLLHHLLTPRGDHHGGFSKVLVKTPYSNVSDWNNAKDLQSARWSPYIPSSGIAEFHEWLRARSEDGGLVITGHQE